MATYNTVPDDETSSLQNKPEAKSLKYIVAGAAAASFLIGVALATATTAGVVQQQTSFKTEYAPDFFNIELASDHSKCLAANGKGDALSVIDCKKHEGQFKKGRNDDGTYVLTSNGDCVSVLRGSAQSVEAGQALGLFTCSDDYAAEQHFDDLGSYKALLQLGDMCGTVRGSRVVLEDCAGSFGAQTMSAGQNFRLVPSSANIPATPRPTPRPHAKPRPSPRPAKKPTCDKNKYGSDCDQDKHHNCCGGGGECGYKWCKYTSKCERVGQCVLGGHNDKDKDCCGGGGQCGYTWCSKQNKCTRSWECK